MRLFRPNVEKMKRRRDVSALARALGDREESVREDAAGALGEIGDPRAVEALCVALRDDHAWVRKEAAWALRKIGDPRAVEPLCLALRDHEPSVNTAAAMALGEIGDATAVEPLCGAADEDDEVCAAAEAVENACIAAISALGDIGGARTVDVLCAIVSDCCEKHDDYGVREVRRHKGAAAAHALGRIGDPQAVTILCHASMIGGPSVDKAASEALEKIGLPDAPSLVPWYAVATQDWSRVGSLGTAALPALCAALSASHIDGDALAQALVQIGPEAVEPLCTALNDEDTSDAVARAAEVLGRIGDPRAVEPLCAALDPTRGWAYEAVARALAAMGVEEGVKAVEALEEERRVREEAAEAARKKVDSGKAECAACGNALLPFHEAAQVGWNAFTGAARFGVGLEGALRASLAASGRQTPRGYCTGGCGRVYCQLCTEGASAKQQCECGGDIRLLIRER